MIYLRWHLINKEALVSFVNSRVLLSSSSSLKLLVFIHFYWLMARSVGFVINSHFHRILLDDLNGFDSVVRNSNLFYFIVCAFPIRSQHLVFSLNLDAFVLYVRHVARHGSFSRGGRKEKRNKRNKGKRNNGIAINKSRAFVVGLRYQCDSVSRVASGAQSTAS